MVDLGSVSDVLAWVAASVCSRDRVAGVFVWMAC